MLIALVISGLTVGLVIVMQQRQLSRGQPADRFVRRATGRQLFLAGDPAGALDKLRKAVVARPTDPALRYLITRANEQVSAQRAVLQHDGIVWNAVLSPDGTRVVTTSSDGTGKEVWNLATGATRLS